MRLWVWLFVGLIFTSVSCFAADIKFPVLTGRVVDEANLLPAADVQKLTSELASYEEKSGQQIVVVIVSSLQGQTIEDYGYRLGRSWGIGQKDKNTGAILLVAPKEHHVRIEVGYGLEGTLTDAKSSDIIQDVILPKFRQGAMAEGVVAGTEAILQILQGQAIGASPGSSDTGVISTVSSHDTQKDGSGVAGYIWLIIIIFFILIRLLSFGSRRSAGLGFFGGMVGGSWGGGSSDSFSGGGGSFGGGGASGSW